MTAAPCTRLNPCEAAEALWDRVADAHHEWTLASRGGGGNGANGRRISLRRAAFDAAHAAYLAHFQPHMAKAQALL